MHLKQSLIIAVTISVISLTAWELYWRSQGVYPTLDDNEALWAMQRQGVEKASGNDVLLIGSSRVLFDIQLNEWQAQTGVRPIQLASVGSSPLPIFHDVVNNTDYNGTILIGVTPGLFFSTTFPQAQPWQWPQSKVDYYKKRTFAQISNHFLSIPLQESFAFISDDQGVDGIKLKELLGKIKVGTRVPDPMPPFHEFGEIALDRNTVMKEIAVTDTAYANSVKKVWMFFGKNAPAPDKESTMAFFLKDLKTFKERGGNAILVRCPSNGLLKAGEDKFLPRTEFWDPLVKASEVKAYYFEDYEQLKHLECPEWSHLSAKDARYFTTELVKIMKADGALSNSKTN
ncbi:hypothetical protein [Gelidibacter algens]|nr:hypothetical protein [Gelidibacter algens]OBX22086.1 hypothetical protein A9996_17365 [Gelidibacter algens]